MVIVILGILAAFALPKFADLSSDAKKASLSGLAGSLKSAAAIARSSQLATGAALGTSVTLDGTDVVMVNG
jgi:MSHA pilin protein MshA